jgi:hypothetical protein
MRKVLRVRKKSLLLGMGGVIGVGVGLRVFGTLVSELSLMVLLAMVEVRIEFLTIIISYIMHQTHHTTGYLQEKKLQLQPRYPQEKKLQLHQPPSQQHPHPKQPG